MLLFKCSVMQTSPIPKKYLALMLTVKNPQTFIAFKHCPLLFEAQLSVSH